MSASAPGAGAEPSRRIVIAGAAVAAVGATTTFFGYNRPGARVSQGQIESFRRQGMMGGIKAEYECVEAFSERTAQEIFKP